MTPNQSSKFNKILKDIIANQTIFSFSDFFFLINESKWFLTINKKQHKIHQTIKTFYTPPQLKVDIVLNVQINACKNQRQVFKLKYKGKGKKAPDMMTNPSSYFLQNG
jgi:hypothetical protein